MELDDFKGIKLPLAGNLAGNEDEIIMDLLKKVEANNTKQRKQAIYFGGLLVVMAVIYLALERNGDSLYSTGMLLLGVGFLSGAVYMFMKSRALKGSLYSLPVTEFLAVAEKRLTYFRLSDWLTIIPILLVLGAGGGMVLISRLLNYTSNLPLLISIWVVFFTGLIIFGYFAGRKNWEKEHGSLINEIRKIKADMP
jgi:hypothetical protein